MEFPSVSPVVSEVLLLSIALSLGFALGWILGSSRTPEPPLLPFLTVSGFRENSGELTITHVYGETIRKAFELENGRILWKNFEVRLNAAKVRVEGGGRLNGRTEGGECDFRAGDVLSLPVEGFRRGDELLLIYVPQGRPLYRAVLE